MFGKKRPDQRNAEPAFVFHASVHDAGTLCYLVVYAPVWIPLPHPALILNAKKKRSQIM